MCEFCLGREYLEYKKYGEKKMFSYISHGFLITKFLDEGEYVSKMPINCCPICGERLKNAQP